METPAWPEMPGPEASAEESCRHQVELVQLGRVGSWHLSQDCDDDISS